METSVAWEPNAECVCDRCEAYYDDPDAFWDDLPDRNQIPSHVDGDGESGADYCSCADCDTEEDEDPTAGFVYPQDR